MKTCLVTGGSRGLGREIVLAFARAGWSAAFCYRQNRAAAESVLAELARISGKSNPAFQCDVSQSADVEEMFRSLRAAWPKLDVLVNNAGITHDALLARMTPGVWDDVLNTDLTGTFFCLREAAAWMAKHCSGHIINIGSVVGMEGRIGQCAYAAAKGGLVGLTRSAARELGASGISVNLVLPGFLRTAMTDTLSAEGKAAQIQRSVLNAASEPRQVAEFLVQLALLPNVSGQIFNLDNRIPLTL